MKFACITGPLVAACFASGAARAQLEVSANAAPQSVFFGEGKAISVTFHNSGDHDFKSEIRTRIYQASSATAAPTGELPWKELRVLPGQTVRESAPLDFPAVRAETKFLIQWLDNSNRVIGRTEAGVYPTNLLDELKRLLDDREDNLGVLDPQNQIKPALRHATIKYVDLEEAELNSFRGRLAIVGPCGPDDPEWRGLADRIARLAQKGTPVVWIQRPPSRRDKIWPSFYIVPENTNAVVVVHPELVADLPDHPQSQLNLIYFGRLALTPHPPTLADLSPNP